MEEILSLESLLMLFALALLLSLPASAQEYYDVTTDGQFIYVDDYADAPQVSCSSGVNITDTLVGVTESAGAAYPNIAHVHESTSATEGAQYTWNRTYSQIGLIKGRICGVVASTTVDSWVGYAINYTQRLGINSLSNGYCRQSSFCTNPPPWKCNISQILVVPGGGSSITCPTPNEVLSAIVGGTCLVGAVIAYSGPGVCTPQ